MVEILQFSNTESVKLRFFELVDCKVASLEINLEGSFSVATTAPESDLPCNNFTLESSELGKPSKLRWLDGVLSKTFGCFPVDSPEIWFSNCCSSWLVTLALDAVFGLIEKSIGDSEHDLELEASLWILNFRGIVSILVDFYYFYEVPPRSKADLHNVP